MTGNRGHSKADCCQTPVVFLKVWLICNKQGQSMIMALIKNVMHNHN
jgi:hypothetical protein